jgi:hypothetical protein
MLIDIIKARHPVDKDGKPCERNAPEFFGIRMGNMIFAEGGPWILGTDGKFDTLASVQAKITPVANMEKP